MTLNHELLPSMEGRAFLMPGARPPAYGCSFRARMMQFIMCAPPDPMFSSERVADHRG